MSRRHRTLELENGESILDIFGADSGDEEDNDDEDEDLDDEDRDAGGDEDDEDEDEDKSSSKRKTRAELERDLEEAIRGRRLSDRERKRKERALEKANERIAELEGKKPKKDGDKDGDEEDPRDKRIRELEEQLENAATVDGTTLIRDEFRDFEKYAWHNRKTAFSLLDLEKIDISDDGVVDRESLEDAIEDLVKEHPYLVKAAESDKDDEEDEDVDPNEKRSGGTFNGRRQSKQRNNRAVLEKRYPVLGRGR